MSGTLPPILLKSSMENSTSDLSNKTNIISCAVDTKSKVRLSRRRETRIRAHLHDTKVVPSSSLTVASYFCSSWRRANHAIIQIDLSSLVDIGSLLYALVNVFHPDWPIRATFRVCRGENLYKAFHQNSWIYRPVKSRQAGCEVLFHTFLCNLS